MKKEGMLRAALLKRDRALLPERQAARAEQARKARRLRIRRGELRGYNNPVANDFKKEQT